jgi:hypothetical protein
MLTEKYLPNDSRSDVDCVDVLELVILDFFHCLEAFRSYQHIVGYFDLFDSVGSLQVDNYRNE